MCWPCVSPDLGGEPQECGLPARKRPGWPPSQAARGPGAPSHPLPGTRCDAPYESASLWGAACTPARLAGRRIEIAGAVAFDEPLFLWSPGLVHAAAALDGGPGFNIFRPPDHMRVRLHIKKLSGFIDILSD